jgi:hypothetical protein
MAGQSHPLIEQGVVSYPGSIQIRINFSQFPSMNGPFFSERRSPRAFACDVRKIRLGVTPCAALPAAGGTQGGESQGYFLWLKGWILR